MSIFAEAFSALKLVESNSNEFKLGNREDEAALKQFLDDDNSTEEYVDVIDVNAIEDEDGEILDDNDHDGDIICRCPECQSLIFFKKDDLVKSDDEDDELVNVDEECPYCKTIHGFKVIGQVEPFETDEVEVADKAEEAEATEVEDEVAEGDNEPDDEELDESLNEDSLLQNAGAGLAGKVAGASVGTAVGGPLGGIVGGAIGSKVGKGVNAVKQSLDNKKEESSELKECGKLDKLPSRKMNESKRRVDNRNHSLKEAKENADEKARHLKERPTNANKWLDGNTDFMWSLYDCKSAKEVFDKFKAFAESNNMLNDKGVQKILGYLIKSKSAYNAADTVKNFWLAGKGLGTSRFNTNNTTKTEDLKEAVQNVSIDTDQETITVATKQDTSAEMITPAEDLIDEIPTQEEVDAETELPVEETGLEDEDVPVEDTGLDLEDEGVDVDVDEFDEDDFSGMGESYLRKTYSNVESFKTNGYRFEGNNIFVEGLITFKGGKKAKTTFAFEAKSTDNDKLYLKGSNKHLSESKDAFTLVGKAEGKKLMIESLEWNYDAKDENGKSTNIKGIENK